MNKITIILKESGSVAELKKNFKIYQGSKQSALINILVPKEMLEGKLCTQYYKSGSGVVTESGVYTAVKIGQTFVESDGKLGKTQSYYVRFLKEVRSPEGEFLLYERNFPSAFAKVAGTGLSAPKLVINVENILNEIITAEDGSKKNKASTLSLITSQQCAIEIEPSSELDKDPDSEPSEFDLLSAEVNSLLQDIGNKADLNEAMLKCNLLEDLPVNISYAKNGYKTSGVLFYNETFTVPVFNPTTKTVEQKDKLGVIYTTAIRPEEGNSVVGYQDEVFSFDSGICKRTIKLNIVKQSLDEYGVLQVGEWKNINQDYISSIETQGNANTEEIEELKAILDSGVNYLGEYPSQSTLPTDEQISAKVIETQKRQPKNGDEFTFVLSVEEGTDVIYLFKYSEFTSTWTKIPFPTIEVAGNENAGLVKGTKEAELIDERKLAVDIKKGEIKSISHKNESGNKEDISTHINRNSTHIAENTADIVTLENNLTSEVSRAGQAETALSQRIIDETTRATSAEQTNASNIQTEVSRATTEEQRLETVKLNKEGANNDYIKEVVFSVNGDVGVATIILNNPVTGQTQSIEVTVTAPASEENTGLMTSDMVKALQSAVEDIENLKYIGRQIASFPNYAEAQLFDFSTIENIKVNDYFIVQQDESRTEPTEYNKTTKYVCISEEAPISLDSFVFQTVVTTVNIQVATATEVGGLRSVNTDGYIYVESNGSAKLVGYDALLTSISNLTAQITQEVARATQEEQTLSQAIEIESERATAAEQELDNKFSSYVRLDNIDQEIGGNKTFIGNLKGRVGEGDIRPVLLAPTASSNEKRYLLGTQDYNSKISMLNKSVYQQNGKLYSNNKEVATVDNIPTKTSELVNDSSLVTYATGFRLQSTQGYWGKIFTSPKLASAWDSINLVFMISDKNGVNALTGTAFYEVMYRGAGTGTPNCRIQRIGGSPLYDNLLAIDYINTPYAADSNYFELYYKSQYTGDDMKQFVILSINSRYAGTHINDYTLYPVPTGIESITSIGNLYEFENIVYNYEMKLYNTPSQLGLTSPTTVKDIANKIIANNRINCEFVIVNDNNNHLTDAPSSYGTLHYIVGSNMIRPIITYTVDVGASENNRSYIGYLIRTGNTVTSVEWREVATDGSEPTFKNLNLIDDEDVSINFNNAEGTALNKIRAAKSSKSLVFNSGGYYFRNQSNTNNGVVIDPTNNIHPENDNQIDLGSSTNRFKDLYTSGTVATNDVQAKKIKLGDDRPWTIEQTGSGAFAKLDITADFDGKELRITSQDKKEGISIYTRNEASLTETDILKITPLTDNTTDIGMTGRRFRDIYVSRNISDGTNSVSVANILSRNKVITDCNYIAPEYTTEILNYGGDAVNKPTKDSGTIIHKQSSSAYATQLALATDSDSSIWRRSYRDGTWTAWVRILNSSDLTIKTFTTSSYSDLFNFLQSNFDKTISIALVTNDYMHGSTKISTVSSSGYSSSDSTSSAYDIKLVGAKCNPVLHELYNTERFTFFLSYGQSNHYISIYSDKIMDVLYGINLGTSLTFQSTTFNYTGGFTAKVEYYG